MVCRYFSRPRLLFQSSWVRQEDSFLHVHIFLTNGGEKSLHFSLPSLNLSSFFQLSDNNVVQMERVLQAYNNNKKMVSVFPAVVDVDDVALEKMESSDSKVERHACIHE